MGINCSRCGKPINNLLCADCNNRPNNKLQKWKDRLIGIFKILIAPIVFPVITTCLFLFYINPPARPTIESEYILNTGTEMDVSTPFTLDRSYEKTPWLCFKISNTGTTGEDDLIFSLSLPSKIKIVGIDIKYDPSQLTKRIKETEKETCSFLESFYSFPSGSAVQYRFDLSCVPTNNTEVDWAVTSKFKNWTKSAVIYPVKQHANISISSEAYAGEVDTSSTNTSDPSIRPMSDTPTRKFKNSASRRWIGIQSKQSDQFVDAPSDQFVDTPSDKWEGSPPLKKSGISLGGYDPLVMTNGLFQLLQSKNIISYDEAFSLKNKVDSSQDGVKFGGVNILKFCELILNSLISKNIISLDQAKNIVEKSKNSGGVLVGGYNIIVLEVEILNVLLSNKLISKEEGQRVIDRSKA